MATEVQTAETLFPTTIHIALISQTAESLGHKLQRHSAFGKYITVGVFRDLSEFFAASTGPLDLMMLELTGVKSTHLEWLALLQQRQPLLHIYGYSLQQNHAPQNLPFLKHLRSPTMQALYQTLEEEIRHRLEPFHLPPAPNPTLLRIVPTTNPQTSKKGDSEVMFFKRNRPQPSTSVPSDPPALEPRADLPKVPSFSSPEPLENPLVETVPATPAMAFSSSLTTESKVPDMSTISQTLESAISSIDGATAAALVEYNSGMMLGSAGGGVNLELAAAGNTDVVRAKMRTMQSLGISGSIEDILITLDTQYHIIYLIPGAPLFLYLVLQKDRANLALARYKLKGLGSELKV